MESASKKKRAVLQRLIGKWRTTLNMRLQQHTASGDTPVLEYRRLRSHISKLVTSRFFQKWCSSGVVSALLLHRTIDFTGFSGTFQDTAVADEQHFCHSVFQILIRDTAHCATRGRCGARGGLPRGAGYGKINWFNVPLKGAPAPLRPGAGMQR